MIFGISLINGCLAGVAFVCIYSLIGGFSSVVFSDFVQFFVMCTSVVIVALLSITTFGGLSFLQENLPETHFVWDGGMPWSTLLVWGLIALSTLVDPNFYQRCFAAKDGKVAKKGILLATLIWCVFDICTTMGGMYAMATIPKAVPAEAYLTYAVQILPDGLKGFFLAGILATILSTLDSYIFVASNTITYDLAPEKFQGNKLANRIGIVFVGALSVWMASYFDGSIKAVWKTFGSYCYLPHYPDTNFLHSTSIRLEFQSYADDLIA